MGKRILFGTMAVALVSACIIVPVACAANNDEQEPAVQAAVEPTATPTVESQAPEASATVPTEPIPEATVVSVYDVPLDLELQLFIIQACEDHHIEPSILFAMAERESRFKADAVGDGGNSLGMFQVQPRWHQGRMDKLGVTDLCDPYQGALVAVDFLAELLERYDGSMEKALTAYNQGSFKGVVTQYAKAVLTRAKELKVIEVEY